MGSFDSTQFLKLLLPFVIGTMGLFGQCGCVPTSQDFNVVNQSLANVTKQVGELNLTMNQLAIGLGKAAEVPLDLIKETGVIDEFLAKAELDGVEPEVQVLRFTEDGWAFRLGGTRVEFEAATEGTGVQLSIKAQDELLDAYKATRDPELLEKITMNQRASAQFPPADPMQQFIFALKQLMEMGWTPPAPASANSGATVE